MKKDKRTFSLGGGSKNHNIPYITFSRNICTHAGWRKSVAIWMCKLTAAVQAEAKKFELLLLFATVQ